MISRKVISIFIICVAIIASIWLFEHNSVSSEAFAQTGAQQITVETSPRPTVVTDADWQKVLQNSAAWNQGTASVVGTDASATVSPGEGTLTDQMAKDFFGQLLQLSQGGQVVTDEDAAQIALNTLTRGDYTKADGVVYKSKDIHVGTQTGKVSVETYNTQINQIFTVNAPKTQSKADAEVLLDHAMQTKDEKDFARLDPLIASEKAIIADLLKLTIPSDAVSVHLSLINAISNILANTEAMRVTLVDPVRSFAAVSQYKQHIVDMQTAVLNFNAYYLSKQ